MKNTKTTTELYEQLLQMPDLHSVPVLDGEVLFWKLYKNAYIRAYCDSYDTCIDIISNSVYVGSLTHWHPDEDEIFDELYALGKKGHMLVLKKTLFGVATFYLGPANEYPLSEKIGFHFGKKKWGGGQLIYLEQA